MGAEQSSTTPTTGKVDGRDVEFYYRNAVCDEEKGIGWKEEHVTAKELSPQSSTQSSTKDGLDATILCQNMIAILPVHAQLPDDYTLLYCAPHPEASKPATSPLVFKTLVLTSPPTQLIRDFTPSGNSCWQTRYDKVGKPSLHIIVSTKSGRGLATSVWASLVKPLLQHVCVLQDTDYTLHTTSSETSITELVERSILPRANEGERQAIVLLSGDGGVIDIVNGLLSAPHSNRYEKPNICILPLGTGNALAHSSGNTADNTLGVSALLRGAPTPLPLFSATFSPGARLLTNEARDAVALRSRTPSRNPLVYGAVVCSWGLHASLVADSDTAEFRKHGAERFQMAAKEALFPADGSLPHGYTGKVSVLKKSEGRTEWQEVEREKHGYVLATFCKYLEKGFTISPQSKVLDKQLRLVHFGPMSGEEAMGVMGKAYAGGNHVEEESVGYDEIECLRIEFNEADPRWRRVCVDGKIVRVEEGGWVEVRSGIDGVVDLVATID